MHELGESYGALLPLLFRLCVCVCVCLPGYVCDENEGESANMAEEEEEEEGGRLKKGREESHQKELGAAAEDHLR